MRLARWHAAALAVLALISSASCVTTMSGQVGYRATITVLNRTTEDVVVWSGEGGHVEISVPPCDEATRSDFPINFWWLSAAGGQPFHSGGGVSDSHSYIVVTQSIAQVDVRPVPLTPCEGVLAQ